MKKDLIKIIISFGLLLIAMLADFGNTYINNFIFIISYLIVGSEILKEAVEHIFKGKIFDENFLMSVATIGAFCIGEYPEAVAVMLFYQLGELFQNYAVDKSRKSISSLMDLRPDVATVLRNGEEIEITPEEIKRDEIIIVRPGEKIPLDGIVLEGNSMLDTMALTGESMPREVSISDEVLSGCINQNGILKIKVTKEFGESTVSKILNLVENSSNRKARSENFISKFAEVYTPIVVLIAILITVLPMLFVKDAIFTDWLYRALSFLVVSCPCALVISIPLSFFSSIGGASKKGILIKGSNYIEALANAEIVVLDKTGTLTEGVFEVQKIEAIDMSSDDLLKLAAHAENYSNHPVSISVKNAYGKEIDEKLISKTEELSGRGISAVVEDNEILIGNERLMKENGIQYSRCEEVGTVLYVAMNKKYCGYILISDKIKKDSEIAIKKMKENGIKKVVMLTGDRRAVAEDVAAKLSIDNVHAELLPDGKVEKVEGLFKEKSEKGKLIFAGDGINDAPVLALADIGIAMGGLGADSAVEASDVVIMTDEPSKIADAIKLSKKTMRIVYENIIFAIAVKVAVLILAGFGLSTMWEAVFADVGVSVIAVLNALRLLGYRNKEDAAKSAQ